MLILKLTLTVQRAQLKDFQTRSPFYMAGITASHLRHLLTVKFKDFRHRLVSSGIAHAMTRNQLWEDMMHEIGVNLRSSGRL